MIEEILYWILTLGLSILIIAITNILGLTAKKAEGRPKIYYVVTWISFTVASSTMIIGLHSKSLALALSPFVILLSSIMIYTTHIVCKVSDNCIESLLERIKYLKETTKVLICLLIYFFIASMHNGISH